MPAKKKKTQLKKVERGFATTSIPKKVPVKVPTLEEPVEENTDAVEAGPKVSAEKDKLEIDERVAALQKLVEKHQDKTEKEIIRTLKNIEYERRMTKSYPQIDLDRSLVEEIVELARDLESQEKAPPLISNNVNAKDKLVGQIGITYGVLRRLGFSEEIVKTCLTEAAGVDLDQAFDWLYLHCPAEELEFEKRIANTTDQGTPMTPKTPDSSSFPSTPKNVEKKQLTSSLSTESAKNTVEKDNVLSEQLKKISAEDTVNKTDSLEDDLLDIEDDDDDPNEIYVRLKMRISDLTGSRRHPNETATEQTLKRLKLKLEEVKKHYFFSERIAEAAFKEKRREIDEASLLSRLRGNKEDTSPSKRNVKIKEVEVTPASTSKKDVSKSKPDEKIQDVDSDSDNAPGGMFAILEPMPTSEVSPSGVTISVRDMALPKHWAGRTPKTLLLDFVSKFDRYAAVLYDDLSGGARVKRVSVHVRWTGGKSSDWSMLDVGCHSIEQAEHYIATVALHALTYPSDEGFRSSGGNPKGAQTSFRLLPPAFRDLWNELEVQRKENNDSVNRDIWGDLSSVLEKKLSLNEKTEDKTTKEVSRKETTYSVAKPAPEYTPEQIRASFYARQSTYAYQSMFIQRSMLPIAAYRRAIIEMLDMSQVIVLSGETGCGKSTQLPSFILEDQLSRGQHCKIVVTEPRRISAISLAQRVSVELGDAPGAVGTNSSLVGYSIRLESQTSKNTRLSFVTNGIALRMLEGGSGTDGRGTAFDDITHVIVDEVHERSIDSDFLLIVLKSLIQERKDLKVILMSATLDAEKISNYFGGCPTIQVPGRTFPVDIRYLEDAVEYTQWTINESSPYAKRVNDKYHRNKNDWSEEMVQNNEEDDDQELVPGVVKLQGQRFSSSTVATMDLLDGRQIPYDLIVCILERMCNDPSVIHMTGAFLVFMPGLGEIRKLNDMLSEHPYFGSEAFRIFPLHSTISSESQSLVFEIPPPGVRKIVIATNIAETGITIPDITCVIDSGKHREMRFDEKRQISRLIETFIAKSNAAQRRGRAGRVQSGICFHLFSRTRHDLMADHPLPEMLRLSLSDLALRIKILKVNLGNSISDVLSKCLDPPSSVNIQRAVSSLIEVNALSTTEEITPMGRLLSKLPTDVHLGKFLLIAALFRCLDPALTIAAALNSKSPFITPFGLEQEADRARMSFKSGNSDFLTIHNAFSSWRRASANTTFVRKFCRQNYLSHQNLQQIEELRQQFLGYLVDSAFIKVEQDFVKELNRARYSRGFKTRFVTVPSEYDKNNAENMALLNAALCAGLYPKLLTLQDSSGIKSIGNNQSIAFHPSSVNFGRKPQDFGVNYLSYFTIMQSKRLYAWETGPADDLAILLLCGDIEFKLFADTVIIDRKIRYRLSPKTSIALKYLRAKLAANLSLQFRGKDLTDKQLLWDDVAVRLLGKVKNEADSATTGLGIVVH